MVQSSRTVKLVYGFFIAIFLVLLSLLVWQNIIGTAPISSTVLLILIALWAGVAVWFVTKVMQGEQVSGDELLPFLVISVAVAFAVFGMWKVGMLESFSLVAPTVKTISYSVFGGI